MTKHIDKQELKEALKELFVEDPTLLQNVVRGLFDEEIHKEDTEFDLLLNRNFEKYADTFKALA